MLPTLRTAATPRAFTRAFSSTSASQVARMNLIGRLGVAPEEIQVSGDRTLVRYSIGTSYGKADNQKTSWFRVASFVEGPQKDFLMSVPKGSLLYIDADARMEVYTDAEGNKRSNLSLISRTFEVLSRPRVDGVEASLDEGLVQEASS